MLGTLSTLLFHVFAAQRAETETTPHKGLFSGGRCFQNKLPKAKPCTFFVLGRGTVFIGKVVKSDTARREERCSCNLTPCYVAVLFNCRFGAAKLGIVKFCEITPAHKVKATADFGSPHVLKNPPSGRGAVGCVRAQGFGA